MLSGTWRSVPSQGRSVSFSSPAFLRQGGRQTRPWESHAHAERKPSLTFRFEENFKNDCGVSLPFMKNPGKKNVSIEKRVGAGETFFVTQ